jgi:hypothetical protein
MKPFRCTTCLGGEGAKFVLAIIIDVKTAISASATDPISKKEI